MNDDGSAAADHPFRGFSSRATHRDAADRGEAIRMKPGHRMPEAAPIAGRVTRASLLPKQGLELAPLRI